MRRKKKKAKNNQKTIENRPTDSLVQEGLNHLKVGRFRESIEIFKVLLKREDRREWKLSLSEAYKGRAKALLKKDMPREAIVVLDHMESVCKTEKNIPLYIEALIGINEYQKAFEYYLSLNKDHRDDIFFKRLETIFASIALSEEGDLLKVIPDAHPLLSHRNAVLDAVKALSEGEDERCREFLKKISFRSPYKDYRLLLRGLLAYYNDDATDALASFKLIPKDTFLKRLSTALTSVMNRSEGSGRSLSSLESTEYAFLLALNGKNIKLANTFRQMKTAFHSGNFKFLFSLLASHASLFDGKALRRFCMGILAGNISVKKQHESIFGPTTPFEDNRIRALYHERKQEYLEANDYWEDCLATIEKETYGSTKEMNTAKALIVRKMAENEKKIEPDGPFDDLDWEQRQNDLLEISLDYDPDDRETYDKIIAFYEYESDDKNVRKWIDRLVQHFPEDVPALLLASRKAIERKAYKKALTFIDRIIELDPINRDAKDKKIFIHVTKARKHMGEKKFHLARKEFEAAVACGERRFESSGATHIKWGAMELLADNEQKGYELFDKGFNLAGGGIGASFLITIESKRMGLPSKLFQKYNILLRERLKSSSTTKDATELIRIALPYAKVDYPGKEEDKRIVLNTLKKTIHCSYQIPDLLNICAYLLEIMAYPLLKKYADNGIRQHPEIPFFWYYYAWGKCEGKLYRLSTDDIDGIKSAFKRAKNTHDMESSSKLGELLKMIEMESYPYGFDEEPEMETAFEDVLEDEERNGFFDALIESLKEMGEDKEERKPPNKKKKRVDPRQGRLF